MIQKITHQGNYAIIKRLYLGMLIFILMMSLPTESGATHDYHHSGHHYNCSAYHHGFHGHGFHGHHYPYHHFPGDSRFSDELTNQERDNVDGPSGSIPLRTLGRGIGGLVRVITFGKVNFPSAPEPSSETQQDSVGTADHVRVKSTAQDEEIHFIEGEA